MRFMKILLIMEITTTMLKSTVRLANLGEFSVHILYLNSHTIRCSHHNNTMVTS